MRLTLDLFEPLADLDLDLAVPESEPEFDPDLDLELDLESSLVTGNIRPIIMTHWHWPQYLE